MRRGLGHLAPLILAVLISSSDVVARPATPRDQARALLDTWLASQNTGDFTAYQALPVLVCPC
jgi:hypothetical protein